MGLRLRVPQLSVAELSWIKPTSLAPELVSPVTSCRGPPLFTGSPCLFKSKHFQGLLEVVRCHVWFYGHRESLASEWPSELYLWSIWQRSESQNMPGNPHDYSIFTNDFISCQTEDTGDRSQDRLRPKGLLDQQQDYLYHTGLGLPKQKQEGMGSSP